MSLVSFVDWVSFLLPSRRECFNLDEQPHNSVVTVMTIDGVAPKPLTLICRRKSGKV